MPDTHGFEIVGEITAGALQEILRAAWDSGGAGAPGTFPHEVQVPPGISLAGYSVLNGQAQILRESLLLAMSPPHNGVNVHFNSLAQIYMDPATMPVPSLQLLNIDADIGIIASFGTIVGSEPNIGVIFDGMPRNQVTVALNADPIGSISTALIEEYVHSLYVKNDPAVLPHSKTIEDQSYMGLTFDVFLEFFSDPDTPGHKITAELTDEAHVKISFPLHLKLYNIAGAYPAASPMGIYARLDVTAAYSYAGGIVSADLGAAAAAVTGITPGPGVEGTNYTLNKTGAAAFGLDMDDLLTAQISTSGAAAINAMGPMTIAVPTNDQIANCIGDYVHQELLNRHYFGVWTPTVPEGTSITVDNVVPKALADALAVCINARPGADAGSMGQFIPPGARFAIALDSGLVNDLIAEIRDKPKDEGGLGGLPSHYDDIEGYEVDLKALDWELQNGKIHFTGTVTVYDVFCGADSTVDFWADVGLRWGAPDASGAQTLEPYVIDKDADLPWWAWLLAVLTFFVGVIVGIIAIVITAVVENLVSRIGGEEISEEVSGKLQIIGAWPQQLQGIGIIETRFDTEVGIDPSGLLFHGPLTATSSSALTAVYDSDAGGPYSSKAMIPVNFHAGWYEPSIDYIWELGDGSNGNGHSVSHVYRDNGLYTVRLTTRVLQEGGALTHHHVPVRIRNTNPVVYAGPDLTIDEGQEITLSGVFEDVEYTDTHEAYWDFGDDSKPEAGMLTETNTAPKAKGIVSVQHAWGDNGDYVIRLVVKDKDGGVSVDTINAKVLNVPPKVTIDEPIIAYPGIPVHLIGNFVDPGWLDTHTAMWLVGDTNETVPATIYEVNEVPFGYGIAVTTHIFERTGRYCAECLVIDDDGGRGAAQTCIVVVELVNSFFENGFRQLNEGTVANGWEPYRIGFKGPGASALDTGNIAANALFDAEEFILYQGQRSQRIYGTGRFRAGIYQRILANKGWEYQFDGHYHCAEPAGGYCRIGIDPNGGHDPASPGIVWVQGKNHHAWSVLSTRTTARARTITVFMEAVSDEREVNAFFDKAELIPYPCPVRLPKRPELPQEEPRQQCIDFADVRQAGTMKEPFLKNGFSFSTIGNEPVSLVLWGNPKGTGKMHIVRSGLLVHLPFISQRVSATLSVYAKDPVVLTAFDAAGKKIAEKKSDPATSGHSPIIDITGKGIASVIVKGGSGEGLLVELCAFTDPQVPPAAKPDPARTKIPGRAKNS